MYSAIASLEFSCCSSHLTIFLIKSEILDRTCLGSTYENVFCLFIVAYLFTENTIFRQHQNIGSCVQVDGVEETIS